MEEKFWTSGAIVRLSLLVVAIVFVVNYERNKKKQNG
jgi:hypothetical protein